MQRFNIVAPPPRPLYASQLQPKPELASSENEPVGVEAPSKDFFQSTLRTIGGVVNSAVGVPTTLLGPLFTPTNTKPSVDSRESSVSLGYAATTAVVATAVIAGAFIGLAGAPLTLAAPVAGLVGLSTGGFVNALTGDNDKSKLSQVYQAKKEAYAKTPGSHSVKLGSAWAAGYKKAITYSYQHGAGLLDGILNATMGRMEH